jgi:DNA-binding LacI/PurR family transcriptional regulator
LWFIITMPRVSRAVAEKRQEEVLRSLRHHIANASGATEFLPPERMLAAELGVSRPMLRSSLRQLMQSGELISHPGIGTRIARRALPRRDGNLPAPVIGLVLPDLGSPFFSEITESIEYAALQHGYQLLLCNCRHQPAFEERHIRMLANQHVAGVILAHDPHLPFPESASLLHAEGIPYVGLFNASSRALCDSVAVDDFSGIYQAMRYLTSLGHKQIAFCRPVPGSAPHPREQAYLQYLREAGSPAIGKFIVTLEMLDERHYAEELGSLLAPAPAPTAFVAGNDQTALLLMKRLSALDRRVPQDISVTGFDNLDFAEFLPVALTTVNQPKREMGRRAVEMLLEHIELSAPSTGRNEVFETYLIIRDSCAAQSE